jgi:uncharacterized protein
MEKGQKLYTRALSEMQQEKPAIATVLKLLHKAYELGNHHAAWALGAWHLRGQYVKKDIREAVILLQYASQANIPDAMYDLAICFEKGDGLKKNEKKAFELYLKAAIRGFTDAIVEVGRCYYWRIGTHQAKPIGELWFDRSKEVGAFRTDDDEDAPPRKTINLKLVVHKL